MSTGESKSTGKAVTGRSPDMVWTRDRPGCYFGGGFGFGTPVVSYAPRPMSQGAEEDDDDEEVIVSVVEQFVRRKVVRRGQWPAGLNRPPHRLTHQVV